MVLIIMMLPINTFPFFEANCPPVISDDVFILGYPLNINNPLQLPIWKRATIASEPLLNLDNLPYFLVDTATRSGMSGSPVIMQRNGLHHPNEKITSNSFFGIIRKMLGVYSGRIGKTDNYESQLGIVWRQQVIEEILGGKVKGDIDSSECKKSFGFI